MDCAKAFVRKKVPLARTVEGLDANGQVNLSTSAISDTEERG
jgi:hypothetical protein